MAITKNQTCPQLPQLLMEFKQN